MAAPDEPEVPRHVDEDALRVIELAKAGWCLEDIATDAERPGDELWVIETLYRHRECFQPEAAN